MTRPETHSTLIDGPAGALEVAATDPGAQRAGVAIVAHPHPLYGGTMDNKVVTTLARTLHELGLAAVRFNFRGVGRSAGSFDEGHGETDDMLAVARWARDAIGHHPQLTLAGFSFGGAIAARAARRLHPARLVLVAPAVTRVPTPAVPEDTLVVHGELDDTVPLKDVLDWARPQELPVLVVPGGEHFFHGRLHLLKRIVLAAWKS
ncbi:MAG TPA: alpha/beta fold hydrolase [Pelomicrobium sp.]|nr:alpha/beta fold hydrolase [Pelomicrobium sp.]